MSVGVPTDIVLSQIFINDEIPQGTEVDFVVTIGPEDDPPTAINYPVNVTISQNHPGFSNLPASIQFVTPEVVKGFSATASLSYTGDCRVTAATTPGEAYQDVVIIP